MKNEIVAKVSIIIPCYNQAEYVGESIESALKQTYENLEIVCINDGSTDNSSEVIKSYAEKYKNIVFLDEKTNRGVCCARNMAIAASSGEYILPLDADDKIEPQYVEKLQGFCTTIQRLVLFTVRLTFLAESMDYGNWKSLINERLFLKIKYLIPHFFGKKILMKSAVTKII